MQQTNTRKPASRADGRAERLHRKQRLAAAFRLWAKLGYDEGPAGHITARDPELLDHFWVNPFGRHFSMISVSDLLLVNHHGEVVEGNDVVNRAAFAIHSADPPGPSRRHRGRPLPLDARQGVVVARSHARSDHPGRVRVLRRPRRCSTTTRASCSRPTRASASPLPSADAKAAILRNHGLLTVGEIGRRGGVVVHHDGPELPGPAARRGGGQADPDRRRRRPADLHPGRARTSPAGSRSSPCTR